VKQQSPCRKRTGHSKRPRGIAGGFELVPGRLLESIAGLNLFMKFWLQVQVSLNWVQFFFWAGFPESCCKSVSQESPGGEKAPAALQGVTRARCTPGLTACYAGSLSGPILQSEYAPIGAAALRRLAARACRQTISAFEPLNLLGFVRGRNKFTLKRDSWIFPGTKKTHLGSPVSIWSDMKKSRIFPYSLKGYKLRRPKR